MRIGFLTGTSSRRRLLALSYKYALMRLRGVVYPDVYCVPLAFSQDVSFIRDGASLAGGTYDLVLSELNGSETQLQMLWDAIAKGPAPVIVFPGPPTILMESLRNDPGGRKRALVGAIIREADALWVYADEVGRELTSTFGAARVMTIPWIFDVMATRRLAAGARSASKGKKRILLNAPLRFRGYTRNDAVLAATAEVWNQLPPDLRARVELHSFVYDRADRQALHDSPVARDLQIVLAGRRSYGAFVRFVAGCDAVVNVTVGAVLGRVTFIAAATGRPGLWSANAELNRRLYPGACVSIAEPAALTASFEQLILGVGNDRVAARFRPAEGEVLQVGDAPANTQRLRQMAAEIVQNRTRLAAHR